MIYLGIFLILMVFALLFDVMNIREGRTLTYYISFIILVSLSGFRYKVGGDTYNYMYTHELLPNIQNLFSTEVGIAKLQPLWLLLSAFAKSASDDFYALQIIHAAIVNSVIFWFIKKNIKYAHTGVLFYYFALYPYYNFEIMRESLAISCFLLSIQHFNSGNWIKYYLLCAAAFLFHLSAAILFVLPIIKSFNARPSAIIGIFVASALLNPIVISVVTSPVIAALLGFAAGYSENNYTFYGLISLFIFYTLIPLSITVVARSILKIDFAHYALVDKGLLFISIIPLFYIFFRFYNYFSLLFVLLAVNVFHTSIRVHRLELIKLITIPALFLIILFMYTFRYFGDTSKLVPNTRWYSFWYPYYTIFDPNIDQTRESLIDAMRAEVE